MDIRLIKGGHYLEIAKRDLDVLAQEAAAHPALEGFVLRAEHFVEFSPHVKVRVRLYEEEFEALQEALHGSTTDGSTDLAGVVAARDFGPDLFHGE